MFFFPLLTTLNSFFDSLLTDINLAGEPKPHRSKTVKRSAGDMYRLVKLCTLLMLKQQGIYFSESPLWFLNTRQTEFHPDKDKCINLSAPLSHSFYSSSLDLDYDFQRDYYDR